MDKPPNLTDRCWDLLEILSVNGNKGMTSREIIEYSKLMGVYDIPDDIQIVSKIAYDFRKRRRIPLLETLDEKHYLTDSAIAALNARFKSSEESPQKDAGLATPAIVVSEADALPLDTVDTSITTVADEFIAEYDVEAEPLRLDKQDNKVDNLPLSKQSFYFDPSIDVPTLSDMSFDFAPSIPPECNPAPTLGDLSKYINKSPSISLSDAVINKPIPYKKYPEEKPLESVTVEQIQRGSLPPLTLGDLADKHFSPPDEDIEILGVEQTLIKNGKYPFLSSAFDSITDWLDAEMAVKTVFIEDKGAKIQAIRELINKAIALNTIFSFIENEKVFLASEALIDIEKLTDIE